MAKKLKLITVRISRKKWYYGQEESVDSALILTAIEVSNFNEGKKFIGKQCCLGFAGRVCKVPRKYLIGIGTPSDAANVADGKLPKEFLRFVLSCTPYPGYVDKKVTIQMMAINDKPLLKMSRAEKEKKLKPLARKLGFRFVFVP